MCEKVCKKFAVPKEIPIFAASICYIKGRNMSTATLTSLLDYLFGTLSTSNMRWVGEHLIEQAKLSYIIHDHDHFEDRL